MLRVWIAEYDGHQIRVHNTWFSGQRLFIDGECRDTDGQLFIVSGTIPRLSARLLGSEGQTHVVEVFSKAIFTVKVKICVDGRQIAGDVF